MTRLLTAAPLLAAILIAGQPSYAQPAPSDPPVEDGRYSFNKVEDGFLRLDNKTGQVALCSRRTVGWACQTVPDERTTLEAEIGRLQTDNAALKRELITRGIALPNGLRPDAAAPKSAETELKLPNNAELDRMMSFIEKVWRRLVEMMANIQRDVLKKT